MPANCAVRGCKTSKDDKTKSTHRFPKDPICCGKWVTFCDKDKLYGFTPEELHEKKHIFVCGDHFLKEDKNKVERGRLKSNAIPQVNPPPPRVLPQILNVKEGVEHELII